MGLEATSWDWLRNGITSRVPNYSLLERVENGLGSGMADVNYVIRGSEGWIEMKAVPCPTKAGTPVLGEKGLRDPDQINWHLRRQQMGSRTWVFISADPYRWLISGAYARSINSMTIEDLQLFSRVWYDEGWKDRQWRELLDALVGIGLDPKGLKG